MTRAVSHPVRAIRGLVRPPGDKSCSHRALIFGALANGASTAAGLLEGDDILRTVAVLRLLGADICREAPGRWRVVGSGTLSQPASPLDFGNSGTGVRLMMGALAGYDVRAELRGDASLSGRPMGRVLTPLKEMGVTVEGGVDGKLPLTLLGSTDLCGIDYAPPQASAQVKSAVLLAGLRAQGETIIREATPTRDHTERMLRGFGADVRVSRDEEGRRAISVTGGQSLSAMDAAIPGDPSSAAFLAAAAAISPAGEVLLEGVMSNDTRDGFFQMAQSMGAELGAEPIDDAAGERRIDLSVASGSLQGRAVPGRLVPAMIDEFPILAVMAAFATGETVVAGAEELRVKESDRIQAIVDMLRANGVDADERPDGFVVEGCGGPPPGGGEIEARRDHRIAMSALVLGTAAQAPVSVDDTSMIATSYPAFFDDMAALGADIRTA